MKMNRKLLQGLLIFLGTLFVVGCPNRTRIAQINADPSCFRDRDVAIAGTVTNGYGVLDNGVYEIDDGTGRVWVVTRRGVPSRGARVGARGRVFTGFNLGGRTFGIVLQESERRTR